MGLMVVFQVVNGVVLETYANERHASLHARAVTGAVVRPLYVRERLSPAIVDDIVAEDDDDATPVQTVIADLVQTKAETPAAIARRRNQPK